MKKFIYLFFMFYFVTVSCNSFNKNNAKKSTKKQNESTASNPSTHPNESNHYYIISFYSIGSGIDEKIKLKLDQFIQEFEQKEKVKLSYKITNWGREGEIDYCFELTELSSNHKDQFIYESKKILETSKLVNIKEDSICKSK